MEEVHSINNHPESRERGANVRKNIPLIIPLRAGQSK
jgi:hypothetical protein